MNHFCILIVAPPGYSHAQAFSEIALGLKGGFSEIGLDVPIITNPAEIVGVPIVLGANLIPRLRNYPLPQNAILYNLEQIQADSTWLTHDYLALLNKYTAWDYSKNNIEALEQLGIRDVKLCEIGYSQLLRRIQTANEDIDILFYGSMNRRRHNILGKLTRTGINVYNAFDIYGMRRDSLIARAKIVLNIHFYEAKVFELVRVSYLLANGRFVISETGSDKGLEAPFNDGVVFSSYQDLIKVCTHYLNEPDLRKDIAKKGQNMFEQKRQSDFLRQAIGDEQ